MGRPCRTQGRLLLLPICELSNAAALQDHDFLHSSFSAPGTGDQCVVAALRSLREASPPLSLALVLVSVDCLDVCVCLFLNCCSLHFSLRADLSVSIGVQIETIVEEYVDTVQGQQKA